ncbi:MAG: C40 family peptidase [Cellulosilyticaceae bacterium]
MNFRKYRALGILIATLSTVITAEAATPATVALDNVPVKAAPSHAGTMVKVLNKGDALSIQSNKSIDGWYQLADGNYIREEYITVGPTATKPNYPYQNTLVINTPVYMELSNKDSIALFPGDKVNVLSYEDHQIKVSFAGEIGFIPMTDVNQAPILNKLKNDVVQYALQWVGNPYVYGGNSLETGTDCSGFVKLIYEKFDVKLERTSVMQYLHNGKTIDMTQIDLGDLIFYGQNGQVSHVAIYMGDGKIVHSGDERTGISVDKILIGLPIIGIKRVY